MKQNITLTEAQLRQVVKESVTKVLKEDNQALLQNSLMTQYSPQEIIKIFQNWMQQNQQLPQENKQALQQAIAYLQKQPAQQRQPQQPQAQPNQQIRR